MASRYRNGNRKRNGYRKRPGYMACGKMVMSDARKALSIARATKALLNVEYKFLDTIVTAGSVGTSPVINQLTNIVQGDGGSSRDGNQVKVVGIYLNYLCTINASATNTQIRVLLVHDSQTNGAIYTSGDLLSDITAVDSIVAPLNLDNKYRFKVLYDRVHHLSDNGNQSISFKKFFKTNSRIRFDGTAGDITDLTSSSYSIMFVSNEATNVAAVTRNLRLRFIDN